MRNIWFICALAMAAAGCGSGTAPAAKSAVEAKKAEARPDTPKPADERLKFPGADQLEAKVTETSLLNKDYLPAGNYARYKKGKLEYELFLAKLSAPESAALLLLEAKSHLTDAKLIPHFGGYYGMDGDTPMFVFSKGPYLAGVRGLKEKDADAVARTFAARIPF